MAKYKVLKPIEYGEPRKSVLYYPADYFGIDKKTKSPLPSPLKTAYSGCNGLEIPIDTTGVIDLPDHIAADLTLGQIAPLDDPTNPINTGYEMMSQGIQKEQEKRGTEDRVVGPGGKEEWKSGAPREVTPLSTSGTMTVG